MSNERARATVRKMYDLLGWGSDCVPQPTHVKLIADAIDAALAERGEERTGAALGDVYEAPGSPVYWTITQADGRYITAESDRGSSIGRPMPWTPPASWRLVRRGSSP